MPAPSLLKMLLRALSGGLLVGVTARLATLIMHTLLARHLGPQDYGVFVYALSLAVLLALIAPLGWQTAITRLIAQYTVEKAWPLLRGALQRASQITLSAAVTVSLMLLLSALLLITDQDLVQGLWFAALLMPGLAYKKLCRRALMGLQRTKLGMFLDDALVSLLMIGALLLVNATADASTLLWVYLGLVIAVCMAAQLALRRYLMTQTVQAVPAYRTRAWFKIALPSILGQISKQLMNRIDVLMLGPMIGVINVGYYSSAFRITYALAFIPVVVGSVISPMLVKAYYGHDRQRTRMIFAIAVALSLVLILPIAALLLVFPETVIQWVFGDGFAAAVELLQVLVIGQLFVTLAGPVATLLTMTGQEKTFGWTTALVLLLNIIGNYFAIQQFGALGAAWVTTLSLALLAVLQTVAAVRHLRTPA